MNAIKGEVKRYYVIIADHGHQGILNSSKEMDVIGQKSNYLVQLPCPITANEQWIPALSLTK